MYHLGYLVPDVAGAGDPLVVGHQPGGADEDVPHPHLAPAVTLPVERREPLNHLAALVVFAGQENALVGDEDVVEDNQRLLAPVARVAHVQGAVLQLAGIRGLAPKDEGDAGSRRRYREGDRELAFVLSHRGGGHDQYLVGVEGAGLVRLGAADHYALRCPVHDVDEHVRVVLVTGAESAVSLHVGHRAIQHHVLLLDPADVIVEPPVVIGAVLEVALIGDRVQRVQAVHPHAPLEAGRGPPAQHPLHQHLVGEVLGALVDVGEAADLLPGQVRRGEKEVLGLRLVAQVVRLRHRVGAGPHHRVVHRVPDPLPQQVHLAVQPAQALEVLFGAFNPHAVTPAVMFVSTN